MVLYPMLTIAAAALGDGRRRVSLRRAPGRLGGGCGDVPVDLDSQLLDPQSEVSDGFRELGVLSHHFDQRCGLRGDECLALVDDASNIFTMTSVRFSVGLV